MSEEVLVSLLLVVDETATSQELARALEKIGHDAAIASSGPEALAKLKVMCYDLALIGLHQPDMSGVDLVARLRQTCPHMAILAL